MAVYTNWYDIGNIPENTPIWACAYEFCNNKETMSLTQRPIRGMIIKRCFHTLKKNSDTEVTTKGVNFYSRKYADTYEECVSLYNSLVQKKIEWFKERIKETEEDFIKEADK